MGEQVAKPYGAIVIGAGHNGLACACYLAKAGLRVLVVEQYDRIGGMSVTEELAGPGFRSDVHASGYLVAKLTAAQAELNLAAHGLDLITPDPNWAQVFPDGGSLVIGRDVETTAASFAQFSRRDAETWRELYDEYLRQKPAIVAGMNKPPVAEGGSDADLRFRMQTARSWVDETFESREIRAFLASAALHAGLAPDDALGARFSWLFLCAVQDVGVSIVRGGMHNLCDALARALEREGGEIRTGARVVDLVVQEGGATGVVLENGERIPVEGVIAANVDPRHLALDILREERIGESVAERARRYEWGPSFFGIYAALDGPVAYKAGQPPGRVGYVHACHASVDAIAQSFVDIRQGKLPSEPMIGIINESAVDPSRAPHGKGLVKLIVHFVPYALAGDGPGGIRGSQWDDVKEAYADHVIDWVTRAFIPDLRSRVVSRCVRSPIDYERRTSSAVHGTHQHGAFLPYQEGAYRPFPGLSGYRTPIPNVYLCGAGAHPGSGISLAPGRNAAKLIASQIGIR